MDPTGANEAWAILHACNVDSSTRAQLLHTLGAIRRVRGWIDTLELRIAARLEKLSPDAERDVARAARANGTHGRTVARRASTANALPTLGNAVAAGELTANHLDAAAGVLAGTTKPQRQRALAAAERVVAAAVRRAASPAELAQALREEAEHDPVDETGAEKIANQRRATRLRTWSDPATGMFRLSGAFDPVAGALLNGRLQAAMAALFTDCVPDTCPEDPIEKQAHLRALALLALTAAFVGRHQGCAGGSGGNAAAVEGAESSTSGTSTSRTSTSRTSTSRTSSVATPPSSETSPDESVNGSGNGPTRESAHESAHGSGHASESRSSDGSIRYDLADYDGLGGEQPESTTGLDAQWEQLLRPSQRFGRPEVVVVIDVSGRNLNDTYESRPQERARADDTDRCRQRPHPEPVTHAQYGAQTEREAQSARQAQTTRETQPERGTQPEHGAQSRRGTQHHPGTEAAAPPMRPGTARSADASIEAFDPQTIVDLGIEPLGGGRVPLAHLGPLLRGARVHRIETDDGRVVSAPWPLDLGRAQRLASPGQRHALRALYRTCAVPGCDVPFAHTKPHHITFWRNGGTTDLHNLLPVCSKHHHRIHDERWHVHRLGPQRELRITLPSGQVLTAGPPARASPSDR
jgi:hypothetical protein